jgi:hypothetical protein
LLPTNEFRALPEDISNGPLRDLKTGTGFADAKLSEILPAARVARFVRMTDKARVARFGRDDRLGSRGSFRKDDR